MTEEELNLETTSEESTGDAVTELTVSEPMQVIVVDSRPFLTTPFSEYSVTEGLLLTLVLIVLVSQVIKFVKGCFAWLLS